MIPVLVASLRQASTVYILVVFATFCFVYVLKIVIRLLRLHIFLRDVPGPSPSSTLWGEEWSLYRSTPGELYRNWHQKYGAVVKYYGICLHPTLSVTDSRAISFILKESAYSFPKPHGVREWFRSLLGEGILWVEGKEAHEKQRRALSPAFSHQSIKSLLPVVHETSAKVAGKWLELLETSDKSSIEIEVTNWAGRFALDTISRAAFSYDPDCLSGTFNPLSEALDGLTNNEDDPTSFYMRALFWVFPQILKVGKKGTMIRRTKQELGKIAWDALRVANLVKDENDKSLIARLIRENRHAEEKLTEEQIISQMRTIISAGYETVSSVIAWILYELSRNSDVQTKLRDEIEGVFEPSFDEINVKYALLDAVVKETLRLHPPVLENHHVASETISVPVSEPTLGSTNLELIVPKGTIISIPVNVIQTNVALWGPDANVFRPDRWFEGSKGSSRLRREVFAFSEGPRACFGRTFAMVEIKVCLIRVIVRPNL